MHTRGARQKPLSPACMEMVRGDEQLSHARLEICLDRNKPCEFELRLDYSDGKRCVFTLMMRFRICV